MQGQLTGGAGLRKRRWRRKNKTKGQGRWKRSKLDNIELWTERKRESSKDHNHDHSIQHFDIEWDNKQDRGDHDSSSVSVKENCCVLKSHYKHGGHAQKNTTDRASCYCLNDKTAEYRPQHIVLPVFPQDVSCSLRGSQLILTETKTSLLQKNWNVRS